MVQKLRLDLKPMVHLHISLLLTQLDFFEIEDKVCCDCKTTTPKAGCPADLKCQKSVCAEDYYCCSGSWDKLCAGAATSKCYFKRQARKCCNCVTTMLNCNSDSKCEKAICAEDPWCCNNWWDSICAQSAAEKCNGRRRMQSDKISTNMAGEFADAGTIEPILGNGFGAPWIKWVICGIFLVLTLVIHQYFFKQ